jgi:DNA-binding transcriptional MerR regulator
MTIDELARETGMTARNIRAHQSRGLLPPPVIRARTGFYGPEHADRVRMILQLQDEGFNLAAIKRLVESRDAIGFTRAVLEPFAEEQPEVVDADELARRFGDAFDRQAIRKAERIGLLRALDSGGWEVPSPTLLRAGEQLVELGIPLRHVLAVGERIDRHAGEIADTFVRLFMQDVVSVHRGDWEQIGAALERMRPLAADAVLAAFRQRMTAAVEEAAGLKPPLER